MDKKKFGNYLGLVVQGFQLKAGFRVKDKGGIEAPKSSLRMLISPNTFQHA